MPSPPPFLADRRRPATLAAALLAALLLLLFRPALSGEVYIAWDYVANNLLPFAEGREPDSRHGLLVDSAIQWHPFNLYYNRCLKEGVLPLVDPFNRFGNPCVGSTWQSTLYPPKLLLNLALDAGPAHNALVVLHLFAAGLGMFLLVRALGAGFAGALLSGLSWMLAGPVIVWAELEFGPIAAAAAPFILLFLHRAFDRRRLADAAVAGLLLGLLVGGCHIQFAVYVALLTAFFLVARTLEGGGAAPKPLLEGHGPSKPPGLPFSIKASATVVLLSFLVAAPTLLPMLELLRDSERPAVTWWEDYTFARMPQRYLLTATFLNPYLFGDPDGSSSFYSWFATNANDFQGYAGSLVLALALVGLVFGGRGTGPPSAGAHAAGAFRWLAGLSLLAALGTPVYWPIYYLLPGGQQLCATRILFLFAFAVSALAGLTLDRLPDWIDRKGPGTLFSLLLVLTLLSSVVPWLAMRVFEPQARERIGAAIAARGADPGGRLERKAEALIDFYRAPSPKLILPGAFAAVLLLALASTLRPRVAPLILLLTTVELALFALPLLPHAPAAEIYPPLPLLGKLAELSKDYRVALDAGGGRFLSDTLKPYGIHDLGGKGPLYPGAIARRIAALGGRAVASNVGLSDFSSPLLAESGVAFVLSARDDPPGFPERLERLDLGLTGETRVFRVKGAKPRETAPVRDQSGRVRIGLLLFLVGLALAARLVFRAPSGRRI